MNETLDFKELEELLERHDYRKLRELLIEENEVNIAIFIEELPEEEALVVFRLLPKDLGATVFSHLSGEAQQELASAFSDQDINDMLERLYLDDAVDFLEEMPANVVKRILQQTRPERRLLINHYLQYPEDSAGSIMTVEFTSLKRSMTVKQAINRLRTSGEDRETIYTCYVTDTNRKLEGVVSVKTLLLADDDESVADLMETDVISVLTNTDQEEVARIFSRYDFLSLPVVDQESRLVGIVTVDDAVDVIQEEATEDFEKMAAMAPSEKPYLSMSVWDNAKNRITWLLVLMISSMITGGIISNYEHAFVHLPILVTFIPMLMDTGGNAGAQTSTMLIRGMALNEISIKDILQVVWKELRIALVVGVILSVVNFIRIYYMHQDLIISLTVSGTLIATVIMAKLIGAVLPLLAKSMKLDPAIMAAPLITTIVDAGSLVVYFHIATLLIGKL